MNEGKKTEKGMEGESIFVAAEHWVDDVEDKLEDLSKNACKMERKGKTARESTKRERQNGEPTYIKSVRFLQGARDLQWN